MVVESVEELGERCDGMGPDADDVVEVTEVKERVCILSWPSAPTHLYMLAYDGAKR